MINRYLKKNRYQTALEFNKSLSKRIFDYLLVIPLLIINFPIFILVAVLIRLETRGPVLFSQERVGLNGHIIKVHKFRTMYHNADQEIHIKQIRAYANGNLNESEGVKLKEDLRITRVGKYLRLLSIDELPQLINVVKNEMSLVGPRPVPVYEAKLYKLWQSERLSTLPGITGL